MANILIIDDEPILLDLTTTVLRLEGHRVTPLPGPTEALEQFASGADQLDLILSDVDMRPITGFETVKRLAAKGFQGRVLFMSGYSGLSEAITGSLGPKIVIEKPFTAPQLRAAVNRILSKKRPGTNELSRN